MKHFLNTLKLFTLLISSIVIIMGCSNSKKSNEVADKVFLQGKIYTVNDKQPWADAVAVKGKKIVFVGSNEEAKSYIGETTEVTNLGGKMMLPGFVEGHIHPMFGTLTSAGLDLQFETLEELLSELKIYAEKNPDLAVIRGFGWRYHMFPVTGPTKELLDKIIPDRPVHLLPIDGHGGWVNSKALEIAGITNKTPDIQPGFSYFQRDKKTGEATGYLVEGVQSLQVLGILEPQTKEQLKKYFRTITKDFAAAGITSVFDAGIVGIDVEIGFSIYKEMEENGELPFRVIGSFYHNDMSIDPIPKIKEYRHKYNTELVKAKILKINVDGGDSQHTGAYFAPYQDKPETNGEPVFSQDYLNELVTRADAEKIDIHYHAFGDRAVNMGLNAIEAAIKANEEWDRRPTVGHALFIQDSDIPRFSELGAIAQMSVQWATPDKQNLGVSVERLGKEYVSTYFSRVRSVIESGATVSLGSDWPAAGYYSIYRPLQSIMIGMTRIMPNGDKGVVDVMPPVNEVLTLEQAIKSNTLNSAYQLKLDDKVGSIGERKTCGFGHIRKELI